MALTSKQEAFCQEYLIDFNATQSAIRAGYSEESAKQIGSDLLSKHDISARIDALKAERSARTDISADFVLSGLKEVAERCLQRAPVMEWDYASKSLVQKTDELGNALWEFDSNGANRAFELLGKHVGVFEKDNRQKSAIIKVEIPDDEPDDE